MVKQDVNFWHQRWADNKIGFHQQDINYDLQTYVRQYQQQLGQHVLLPLCGKSLDMLWLKEQGYAVTGIEISEQAIEAFFYENNLAYKILPIDGGQCYQSDNLRIIKKSFFDVTQEDLLQEIDWIYDRAALIALDEDLRKDYTKHLSELSRQAKHMLCVCMEKEPADTSGPPFTVLEEEVRRLYKNQWHTIAVTRNKKTEVPHKTVYCFFND